MSTQIQMRHCEQMSILFNQLPACTSTQQLNKLLSMMDAQISAKPKYFMDILCLLMNSKEYPTSTKVAGASYMARHIQKHYLHMDMRQEQATGSLKIDMNKNISILGKMIESQQHSGEQYKYKRILVDVYIELTLELSSCRQSVNKLVGTAKYYYGKRYNTLAIIFTEKLLTNSRDRQECNPQISTITSKNKHYSKYNTKTVQAYEQLMPLLMDNVHHNTCKLYHSQEGEWVVRECTMGMSTLAEIISDMRSSKCMEIIMSNQQMGQALGYSWLMCRECVLGQDYTPSWKHRLLDIVLFISQQMLSYYMTTPHLNSPGLCSTLLQMGQSLWQICIQTQHTHRQHTGINTNITKILMYCIQMQGSTATQANGHKQTKFNASQDYLLHTFVLPAYQSFMSILAQVDTSIQDAMQMITLLQEHVYSNAEGQEQEVYLYGQDMSQPVVCAYIKIINKLSFYFSDMNSSLKVLIQAMISNRNSTVLDKFRQQGINTQQIGMIIGNLCASLLMSCKDWLHQLYDMFCSIHDNIQNMSFTQTKMQMQASRRYRVAGLLLYRMHMDDMLYEVSSKKSMLDTCISILQHSSSSSRKVSCNTEIALCLDILQHYYSTFSFPYEYECHRVQQILLIMPNKHNIQLQMRIMQVHGECVSGCIVRQWIGWIVDGQVIGKLHKHQCIHVLESVIGIITNLGNKCNDYQQHRSLLSMVIHIVSCVLPKLCTSSTYTQQKTSYSNRYRKQVLTIIKQCLNALSSISNRVPSLSTYQQQFKHILVQHLCYLLNSAQFISQQQSLSFIYVFHPLLLTQNSSTTAKQLIDTIVSSLDTNKSMAVQTITQLLIMLHNCISHLPQCITLQHIQTIISIIDRHSHRRNKALMHTDISYLYIGKIYLTLILLLKYKPAHTRKAINNMRYDHINGDNKYKYMIAQLFCNARNYVPNYDVPVIIRTMCCVLADVVGLQCLQQVCEQMGVHLVYAHFYIKLLLQSVERLYAFSTTNTHNWQQQIHKYHNIQQYNHHDTKLLSHYCLVDDILKHPINYSPDISDINDIFCTFKAVYEMVREKKNLWLKDILQKFISRQTIDTILLICETTSSKTSKQRNIVTVKKILF